MNLTIAPNLTTDPIVIVGSARTPIGAFQGMYSKISATTLGSIAIKAAIERATLSPNDIDEVLMGCVLSAGLGQAPARQAALGAEIPTSVPCTTVNKICGSGMKSIMLAQDILTSGRANIVIAGGMENMTRAPYLLDKARSGYRLGHDVLKDHMFLDGLEDAYDSGKLMGYFAELTAEKYGIDRQSQDDFALISLTRAKDAIAHGWFQTNVEVVATPVSSDTKNKDNKESASHQKILVVNDEHPMKVDPNKIPYLKPSFKTNGTITPANSSAIADGATALVLTRYSFAKQRKLPIVAKILGFSSVATEPNLFTIAPVSAIKNLLKQLNWSVKDAELYEINEAFAVVTMVAMKELDISHNIVNIHGGACALGHPIGNSGARIISSLLGALQRTNKTKGIASLCIGGGEATAMAIELNKDK